MTVKIKRLFHGVASVRDYQAKQATDAKEDLVIIMGTQSMRIPYNEIASGKTSLETFQSVHEKGLSYHLVDFLWKPSVEQETLL